MNNKSPFAQPNQAPPGQSAIGIDHLIGTYIGIASIPTPVTEKRKEILDQLEVVIHKFVASLNFGVQQ